MNHEPSFAGVTLLLLPYELCVMIGGLPILGRPALQAEIIQGYLTIFRAILIILQLYPRIIKGYLCLKSLGTKTDGESVNRNP